MAAPLCMREPHSANTSLKIMRTRFALLCLLALVADAHAADSTTTTNTTAPNKLSARQVVAPTISVTRAVRNADGSLSFVCDERPNPKAQLIQKARAAQTVPDQQ